MPTSRQLCFAVHRPIPEHYAGIVLSGLNDNKIKAAPRFELGMEVLQTSALPLGYAADCQHENYGFELP
jgi:hypothetical protein